MIFSSFRMVGAYAMGFSKNDLNPTRTLLPERCTKDVNVYEVSFVNNRWGSRIYGILCLPVKPGKYPALLRVPGAGVRPYGGDVYTASKGAITLEIGVHGIPVTMEQNVYDRLLDGALNGYWDSNVSDIFSCTIGRNHSLLQT